MSRNFQDEMKPNCYLCVIDYLLRKGFISPDDPGYLDVFRELRSGSCQQVITFFNGSFNLVFLSTYQKGWVGSFAFEVTKDENYFFVF